MKTRHRVTRTLQAPAIKRMRHDLFSPRLWLRRLLFWGGALCVAATAILFAIGAEYANDWHHALIRYSPFLPFIITPLGLAGIAWVTQRFFTGAQGSGIPQTIAALQNESLRDRVLSLRIAFGKIVFTLVGMLCGASIGREGPTVQIGAAIMHSLGNLMRFPRVQMQRGLILAGGAAGIAAAFNTPLAGIVFAIEEMSRSLEQRTSGTILTAVIIAGVCSLAVLGDYPYFGYTSAALPLDLAWIAVLCCGALGGLMGGLFSRLLIASSKGLPGRIGEVMRERPVAFAAACGVVLAVLGLFSGSTTYGTGYEEAKLIIEGREQLPEAYGIMKMLATIVSYVSGIPGGIFAPSLAVGAGFGLNISQFMPYAPHGAVVLLTMAAYLSGVVQAPITCFVIVVEMTDNHNMVLPLMAATLIASGTSRLICRRPLYKTMADAFLASATAAVTPPVPPVVVAQVEPSAPTHTPTDDPDKPREP